MHVGKGRGVWIDACATDADAWSPAFPAAVAKGAVLCNADADWPSFAHVLALGFRGRLSQFSWKLSFAVGVHRPSFTLWA